MDTTIHCKSLAKEQRSLATSSSCLCMWLSFTSRCSCPCLISPRILRKIIRKETSIREPRSGSQLRMEFPSSKNDTTVPRGISWTSNKLYHGSLVILTILHTECSTISKLIMSEIKFERLSRQLESRGSDTFYNFYVLFVALEMIFL